MTYCFMILSGVSNGLRNDGFLLHRNLLDSILIGVAFLFITFEIYTPFKNMF